MSFEPYFAYLKKSFLNRSAYRFDHIMSIFSSCLRMFIFWEIYKALYSGRQDVEGITMSMVTTSFILSMGLESVFYINDYFLPEKVWNGNIATELLRPISFKGRMLAENMGNAIFNLIFHFLPALLIASMVMGILPPAKPMMLLLFVFSACIGYGVLWSLSFIVQTSAIWSINVWGMSTIKNVFVNVLSGTMIPLWFMPTWMEGVIKYTPFSSIYFTPVQIYLGELSLEEIGLKCTIQLVWLIVIFGIGEILWRKGQRKLVVQGG